ncbi:MAG TPA: outer membrane lipoprotein carrier protein LolA [Candidatus Kapabacteria bacterium]|nr:outer membrane lipoprotein carrier protein LolA [Candidatus Kapabacteria bacterium]
MHIQPRQIATILLLVTVVLSTGLARTRPHQTTDVKQIVQKVKSIYASTSSAEIRFEQTGGTGNASGTLVYQGGDRYRLDLPKQTIVSDGTKVWTYTPEKKQVVISRASKGTGRLTPEDILTAFPGNYATELAGEEKLNGRPVWIVRCTPGAGGKIGDVTKATLYIDKSTYRFQQVDIEGPSVGSLKLRILSARYGGSIPASTFTFNPPGGVRVVDLSK